jgi:transposase InsO family protein
MDIHKNARSCPASRELLIKRVDLEGWLVDAAARAAGMSRRRASEWLRRARAKEPLHDRSSSRVHLDDIGAEKREVIVKLRRERIVMRRIAVVVGVSVATVARVCAKAGLSRLSSIDPPPAVRRYERAKPGELLHIDIKKLGRIGCIGHRITGDPSVRSRNVGWEFVHVAIDDRSRVAYAEILDNERAVTSVGFLSRAVDWFAKQGVRIERVMTDNGVGYVSHEYAAMCRALEIKHIRTKPYTPKTNGKAERFIQTLLREWAYRFTYSSSVERGRLLPSFLHFYNHHRAHSALGYLSPICRLVRNNVVRLDS